MPLILIYGIAAGVVLILFLLCCCLKDRWRVRKVEKKVVLVTGCDSGFGHDFAVKCVKHGMTVFASCLMDESVEQLKKECSKFKGTVEVFQMDVTSDSSVHSGRLFVEERLKALGGIGLFGLVNNAGIAGNLLYDDMLYMSDYVENVEVNAYGVIRVTHAFKDLVKKARGRIVFCTTGACRFATPAMGPYVVSKFAVTGYSDVLRHELAPFGVMVITVEPGMFRTPMHDLQRLMDMKDAVWRDAPPNVKAQYGEDWIEYHKKAIAKIFEVTPPQKNEWVVDAYFRAVTARYPFRNYVVGYDAVVVQKPYSHLPYFMQPYVINTLAKVVGEKKPAAVDAVTEPTQNRHQKEVPVYKTVIYIDTDDQK